MYKIFLVVPPGIEQIAIDEVNQLSKQLQISTQINSLEFECDLDKIYKLNLLLRIPNRILIRFADFEATTFQDLFKKAVRLPWKQFLKKSRCQHECGYRDGWWKRFAERRTQCKLECAH